MKKRVWWAILPERCVYDISFNVGLQLAYRAALNGYRTIYPQYGRTDVTRQALALAFLEQSKEPKDTLIMLDVDHDHPPEMMERLVAHDVPIVTPLMFRRGEPFQACAFRRGKDGELHHLANFPMGLHRMDAVGTGAIAIQRQVFERLREAGHQWFFKYEYDEQLGSPSEDLYFSKICEQAGIEMYVDTTIESPHITYGFIDRTTHDGFMQDNPDALGGTLNITKES